MDREQLGPIEGDIPLSKKTGASDAKKPSLAEIAATQDGQARAEIAKGRLAKEGEHIEAARAKAEAAAARADREPPSVMARFLRKSHRQ
ncbi:hypothetical protein A2304_01565 [Candidatus Uhrbacteria bacterium RIFOXYB2_FULL_57_15]|uniref:Uncharacterized protein n=1 Tax=Candidatus Uhrbacteria bacterium RIFOXYB2_FULL_57_15 TaxID=1802422 RepID=A0A1F7W6B7_9BACT|nr:MAG: hypothetical protein A2304_01565 [Candidatus Uhrbacteria bacterium RIFOXYB2_FULL_57_15]